MSVTSQEATSNQDAMALIFKRNTFYQRKFHLVVGVFALSIVVIVILFSMLIYLKKHPPRPVYFVADSLGRLIRDVPVQEPVMSNEDVAIWVQHAVEAAYSYDYVNYRAQLQSAQKYFSDYGWRKYMAGLTTSNNLLALTQRKLIIIAKVVETPQLMKEGPIGSQHALAWRFQMPVLVTYLMPPYDAQSQFSNPLQVTVIVQRQKLLESYEGLGVIQMNAVLLSSLPSAPNSSS